MQDNFLTPTARFADVVLPACTQFETWGVEDGWKYGDEVILMPKLVEPPGETRSDYRICADIAERLGIGEAYTEGRDERGWVEWCLDHYRADALPGPAVRSTSSSDRTSASTPGRSTKPAIAFEDFRARSRQRIRSTRRRARSRSSRSALYDLDRPDEIPAVPKYIQEWESPFGPEAARYPLQVIGHHTLHRVHSTHDNNDWLEEAFPQRAFINPIDARGARHRRRRPGHGS